HRDHSTGPRAPGTRRARRPSPVDAPAPRPSRGPPLLRPALGRAGGAGHLGTAFAAAEPARADLPFLFAAALPDRPPRRTCSGDLPRRSAGAVDGRGCIAGG